MTTTRCSASTTRWRRICSAARRKSTSRSGVCRWRSSTAASCRPNFAELNNIAGAAYSAGASTAAAFLSHFVTRYQQGWLHIDCSATYRKGAVDQWSAGATGLGVRAVANLLLSKAK
ncbi:Peptidase B [Serratia rubidaea]|uniref:Peptidase B n=1 Tax=Serratia rubidaea TaxID=61652 RepID=A0A4U9HP34_SERRU|nr:Peptidase B [Serratia rubidaea]